MSSTEPPSRIPPRQQPQQTKAAREELSSKGKVEKVREVDPDEETRKKKFLAYYKGVDEEETQDERPNPFDVYSGKQITDDQFGTEPPSSQFSDIEDAIVPGPSYSPPPNLDSSIRASSSEDEESLPQSSDFWDDFGLPDQPSSMPQSNFQETPAPKSGQDSSQQKKTSIEPQMTKEDSSTSKHKKRVTEITKKEEEVLTIQEKVEKKGETHDQLEKKKKEEPSLFGLPGKLSQSEKIAYETKVPADKLINTASSVVPEKKEEKKKLPSLLETPPASVTVRSMQPPLRVSPAALSKSKDKTTEKEIVDETVATPQTIGVGPITSETRGGEGEKKEGGKEEKILEIEAPSLSNPIPNHIQPLATAATSQAAPYLTSPAVSLFYQMVGTMHVMTGTQGVSRTEVILNNPAYANSKFFGATITIEKYATAPDSFNIRLSGSQEAVAAFKDNVSSLFAAFENGNFSFRIGRIDAEYALERPLFRRKEKSEEKGEAGGGDLGERKK